MAFSASRSILVFCVLHMTIPICVHGKYGSPHHYHEQQRSVSGSRPFISVSKAEISRLDSSNYDYEGRRLESVEIRALINSKMKTDHVEIRCQGLRKGMLVKDFDYVTLMPGEGNVWSAEQIDLSPDRLICIMFWKRLYLINDVYFYNSDHNGDLKSDWDIDEAGLKRLHGSGPGSDLVQTWREQKP